MKEDKIVGGKVYSFFDWVWRLMVLNMLTIICSIGIITICPAICACFRTIKETKENYTPKIFKPYFNNFKYLFRDTWGFSIALVIFVVVCGYGYLWYDGVVGATLASGEKLDKIWLMIAIFSIVMREHHLHRRMQSERVWAAELRVFLPVLHSGRQCRCPEILLSEHIYVQQHCRHRRRQ